MNISLFYQKTGRLYLKRAIASLLSAVLLSLLIPGVHILFYLFLVIFGIAYICLSIMYAGEVARSREALQSNAVPSEHYLIAAKSDSTACFFGFDGVMKLRACKKRGIWRIEGLSDSEKIVCTRWKNKMELVTGENSRSFLFSKAKGICSWKGTDGMEAVIKREGEGWHLFLDDRRICTISRGWLPQGKQHLFDPSSILIHFKTDCWADNDWTLIFVLIFLDNYYLI
ncbi:hypothetical protein [Bacillus sp. AK031]